MREREREDEGKGREREREEGERRQGEREEAKITAIKGKYEREKGRRGPQPYTPSP